MHPRQILLNTVNCRNTQIPVFAPAIYDYKANFTNENTEFFWQSEHELLRTIDREILTLESEVVTCGYDIYNIEAEALGSRIIYKMSDIFPDIRHPLINSSDEILDFPDFTELRGRMPMMINITKSISKKYTNQVYVRGAVSGPFSMAGKIYDQEKLIMDCIVNPEAVHDLLAFCTKVIVKYTAGYFEQGLDVIFFDSLASPPVVSPDMYRNIIFPYHKKIFDYLISKKVNIRPLIMGGNILPIIKYLVETGANQFLLDYTIPVEQVMMILDNYPFGFRINLDPGLIENGNADQIKDYVQKLINTIGHKPNLLWGTGIIQPDTPIENIWLVRDTVKDLCKRLLNG